MHHLQGNLLCVIDTETTGLNIEKAEIIELCIMPVDSANLSPSPTVMPLHIKIRPDYPDDVDWGSLTVNRKSFADIMSTGMSQNDACDLVNRWFGRIGVSVGKKVMPLGHNYASFDKPMLEKMLGQPNYNEIFHHYIRCTMTSALYANDRCYFQSEELPFPTFLKLSDLAKKLNVAQRDSHTALDDCLTCLECYRRMMGLMLGLNEKQVEIPKDFDAHISGAAKLQYKCLRCLLKTDQHPRCPNCGCTTISIFVVQDYKPLT